MSRTAIAVRSVEPSDMDAIIHIDEKLSDHARKEYWRQRLHITVLRPPWRRPGPAKRSAPMTQVIQRDLRHLLRSCRAG